MASPRACPSLSTGPGVRNGFYMNFNASLVRRTAAAMKRRGLLEAGFSYLSIGGSTYPHPVADEAPPWRNLIVRNATGFVQIDPGRFPGPGSNMTMCEDAALLRDCLGQGARQRLPQQCGCVDGNAGMKKLIADVHAMGFLWGSCAYFYILSYTHQSERPCWG